MSSIPEATVASPRTYIAEANAQKANGFGRMLKGTMETVVTSVAAPLIPPLSTLIHSTAVPVEWGVPAEAVELGLIGLALLAGGKGIVDVVKGAREFVHGHAKLAPAAIQAQQESYSAEQADIREAIKQAQAKEAAQDYSGCGAY